MLWICSNHFQCGEQPEVVCVNGPWPRFGEASQTCSVCRRLFPHSLKHTKYSNLYNHRNQTTFRLWKHDKITKTLRSILLQAKPSVVADLVLPHIPLRSQYSWRGGDRKSEFFDLDKDSSIYIFGFGLVRFSLNICHIHACNINTKEHFPINSKLFRCSVLQTETSTTTGGTQTTFQGLLQWIPQYSSH